jgi:DNA polymerase III delta prime subunit
LWVSVPISSKFLASCGLALALVTGAGCNRDDRVRAEAHTFLALYKATDHRASIAERERKIAQLEQLTLSEEAVRTARDQCVGAHRALIRAERENETASGELERAVAAQPDGGSLMAADTLRIRAEIERAEGSLTDARGRFEKCEAQARTLSLRFGDR